MTTALQDLMAVTTGIAALAVIAFILAYARLPWWTTGIGRSIMASGLAVGLLTAVGVVRRIDVRVDAIHLTTPLSIGSVVAYLVVAGVYLTWTWLIVRRKDEP